MPEHAVRYTELRDRRIWDAFASLPGIEQRIDGSLALVALPASTSGVGVQVGGAFDTEISGVAVLANGAVFCSSTADPGGIVIKECGCCELVTRSDSTGAGQGEGFKSPSGLIISGNRLLIADTDNHRVLTIDLRSLRQLDEWRMHLQSPACLAADRDGCVYVLDIRSKRLDRFSSCGDQGASLNIGLTSPACIAIDGQDALYVTDADSLRVFDTNSGALGLVGAPATAFKPRAMAARGKRLYVADAESGFIWAFDALARSWLGPVRAYRGPVSALAIDESGNLYVKPGADETVYRFDVDAGRVESGTLLAGPLDAGEGDAWERIWVDADIPADTSVSLEVATADDGNTTEADLKWRPALALDLLLRTLLPGDAARFIWLRVTLRSHDGRSTPTLRQVQAATAQASYLDHLPAIYRRDDAPKGFLERWLALLRSEFADWDQALENLPRELDARTVGEGDFGQLAAWLALVLPPRMPAAEVRQLLADAPAFYRQRGTPLGLREQVRRELGATIHIFEAFRERRIWQLGEGLGLGLDTALAAGTPGGVVVPGFTHSDRRLFGLRGDYHEGTSFEVLRHTRHDDTIDFRWADKSPLDGAMPPVPFPANYFSVRWTGQVRPRYSETYIFRTHSDDGVRLWVAGRKIIDNWTDHPPSFDSGQVSLEAGRWYPITLEFYEKAGNAQIELYWFSASQPQEIVPQDCLYSVLADAAEMAPQRESGRDLMEVGHAVVGEGRPQGPDDYGAALSDDHAHLFTVIVAAAHVPLAAQRQALRDLIEREKPAHTDFQLCLVEPRMRVGIQARIGIDAIVAGAAPPLRLGTGELGSDSYLAGQRARHAGDVPCS